MFACNIAHLDEVQRRGTVPIESSPTPSVGSTSGSAMDFFEDIGKLRAARQMWHDILRDRYGITDERALRLRIHIVTAGSAMTYQEPINNIVRGTIMGMAAVLGGVAVDGRSRPTTKRCRCRPSRRTSSRCAPSRSSCTRPTSPSVADPLGGSYYVESLTAELEERAYAFLAEIEPAGGFIAAVESGFLHGRRVRQPGRRSRSRSADGTAQVVGVNLHRSDHDPFGIDGFQGSIDAWERGMERLERLRAERDRGRARPRHRRARADLPHRRQRDGGRHGGRRGRRHRRRGRRGLPRGVTARGSSR